MVIMKKMILVTWAIPVSTRLVGASCVPPVLHVLLPTVLDRFRLRARRTRARMTTMIEVVSRTVLLMTLTVDTDGMSSPPQTRPRSYINIRTRQYIIV